MNIDTLLYRLRLSFDIASSRGVDCSHLLLAEQPIQLCFASPILKQVLMPSLQGGVVTEDQGLCNDALIIRVWDGIEGHFPCLDVKKAFALYPDKISVVNVGSLHLQYNPQGDILCCIDTCAKEAYYYVADPQSLPDYEICTPMRLLFNWHCTMHGSLMVHAASVGSDGVGVLLIGKSGAGKSTTGLTCLVQGMEYLGDDYVAVRGQNPTFAYQLYRGCKVMDDALVRLPELQRHVVMHNTFSRKSLITLDGSMGRLVSALEIAAIIRPRVCHAEKTTFARLSPMEIAREFAASTIMQMPGVGEHMIRDLVSLCSALPAVEMNLGRDPSEIALSLQQFLYNRQYL